MAQNMATYESAPVVNAPNHDVLFQLPLQPGEIPKPNPPTAFQNVDSDEAFVDMPNAMPPKKNFQGWQAICKSLSANIKCFDDLKQAILSYANVPPANRDFKGLENYLKSVLNKDEQVHFFEVTLPKIIQLALSLPEVVTGRVCKLQAHSTRSISLSQVQIGCLLANAFLCTFPQKGFKGHRCGSGNFPDINFQRLFAREESVASEKFKCIFSYFVRITSEEPIGVVTFTRRHIPDEKLPDFLTSKLPLASMDVKEDGCIEHADGFLQMDFADKYIGGMVLTKGCVQEEIRFLCCPELIVARLFTEKLDKTEALIVTGVEQYNLGKGYSRSFQWLDLHRDQTPMDSFQRRKCELVAIDAISFFRRPKDQYQPQNIFRDIYKAYAGFARIEGATGPLPPVATGNWGCGVFEGNPQLKGLLQLVAASMAGRLLTYFTFGNQTLVRDLTNIHKYLTENDVTIGELVTILTSYEGSTKVAARADLYSFIHEGVKKRK